jgi:signal transduction histidine kinase
VKLPASKRISFNWFQISVARLRCGKWRLSIASKIACGYSLAISVAILGTIVGLMIGDSQQKRAQEQLVIARQQQQLLSRLEREILELRSHPQRLMMVFGDSIWFDFERTSFLGHVQEAKEFSAKLNQFTQQYPTSLAIAAQDFEALTENYASTSDDYSSWAQSFWQKKDPGNLRQQEIPAAQQALLTEIRSERVIALDVKFSRLTEQLNQILKAAEEQQTSAEIQLHLAEDLRLQIILLGMGGAGLMAAILAIVTSRAIAKPIKAVTSIAQQVTRESNFDLQVPVTSQDEIGVLAASFNNLIQKVAEYTHELELGQQLLENRVEERTQELRQALQDIQKTQAQLIQAEKMSSLGQLVAGVAHEINNPVNFIHGNLTYADQYTQELLELLTLYQAEFPSISEKIRDKIDEIDLEFLQQDLPNLFSSMKVGADRIREIVLSLRTFSRLDEADIKAVDIHEGIDSTLMILQSRLKAKPQHSAIEVMKEYGTLPTVECYAGQLNQVFMNILTNAIDALEEVYFVGKEVTVGQRLDRKSTAPAESMADAASATPMIRIRTEQIDEQWVEVAIADNGPGMTEEVQQRLFDPFFTTKAVGKGTGLGMSISYQIVTEKHGGSLVCTSTLGQGTEFVIQIPIKQAGHS